MADEAPRPLTVVRLEVDAFKRMRAARLHPPRTGLVPVRGKNEQGKSSLIESMEAALLGKDGAVDLPIMEGQHGAHVLLDLGEIVVKRTWTRDSGGKATTKLLVEDARGVAQASPQKVLDALVGHFADPVAFIGKKPDEQVKIVLAILGLDAELAKLEGQASVQFDERRDLGRVSDQAKKHAQELAQAVEGIPVPDVSSSAEELGRQLEEAKTANGYVDRAIAAKADAESRGRAAAERLKALELEIQKVQGEIVEQRQRWEQAAEYIAATPKVDTAPIHAALRDLEEAQRMATKRELLEQARVAAQNAEAEHAEADRKLEETRGKIRALLGSAKFPVEGMSYDHERKALLVGGIPFGQASSGEKLKISAGIAMAGTPRIRVLFIRDGSMLDEDNLALVAELAEANGFQLWCEIVSNTREGAGVWIEDGEAFENEGGAA